MIFKLIEICSLFGNWIFFYEYIRARLVAMKRKALYISLPLATIAASDLRAALRMSISPTMNISKTFKIPVNWPSMVRSHTVNIHPIRKGS